MKFSCGFRLIPAKVMTLARGMGASPMRSRYAVTFGRYGRNKQRVTPNHRLRENCTGEAPVPHTGSQTRRWNQGETVSHRQPAFARRAFTLVELLVVIGIIALLIAILLPALNNANASAQRLKCLSNLRQMVLAAQSYVNQNQGFYPIAYYSEVIGSSTYSYSWDLSIVVEPPAAARIVPGLLWQGDAPLKIQQCPTFDGKSNTPADPYTGYNYNVSYIGHGQYENVMAPAKATSIRRPSETAIFGDGQFVSGANKYMRAPFDSEGDDQFNGRWAGTQGFRHRGYTNVAFCDGHAESLRDRYTNTDDYGGADNIAAGTGFLSPDNRLYGEH